MRHVFGYLTMLAVLHGLQSCYRIVSNPGHGYMAMLAIWLSESRDSQIVICVREPRTLLKVDGIFPIRSRPSSRIAKLIGSLREPFGMEAGS